MEMSGGIRRGQGLGAALLMRGGEGGKKSELCGWEPSSSRQEMCSQQGVEVVRATRSPCTVTRARQHVSQLVRNLLSMCRE